MDDKLIFGDGSEWTGHVLETDGRLFVYLYGTNLTDAFALLNDPTNTKTIKWKRYGQEGKITGYKHLCSISEESGGAMIAAMLKKV